MIVTDKFAFIEMPRTGSTRVKRQLLRLVGGERVGMHDPAPLEILSSGRVFLGSIRNPWDWYVSKWTIGCGGTGVVYRRVTRPRQRITKGPNRGLVFDPEPWRPCYRDRSATDVNAFRRWLQLLSTPRAIRTAFPNAYGRSGLHTHAGYYSYLFAFLFCDDGERLHAPGAFPDPESVEVFMRDRCYIDRFIRTEHLTVDLLSTLRRCGVSLTREQVDAIRNDTFTNASHRPLPVEAYYDDESLALVARREHAIIERFGYAYPPLARSVGLG